MALNLTVNGVTYSYPETGDEGWGDAASNWANAITSGTLQKAGGSFTLTAEVDFGATYGLKSAYFKTRTANPAAASPIRLSNDEGVAWRNAANGADLVLKANASDLLEFNGSVIQASPASTTDNAVARYNGTTGVIQNSSVIIDDSNNISGVGTLSSGVITQSGTTLANSYVALQSSTDNRLTRFDSTAGQIQGSGVTLDDSDNLTGVVALTLSGLLSGAAATFTGNVRFPAGSISDVGLGGSNSLGFYTNSSNLYLTGNGSTNAAQITSASNIVLYSAGTERLKTSSTGVQVTSKLSIGASAPGSDTIFTLNPSGVTSGTTQWGAYISPTFSGATTAIIGLDVVSRTGDNSETIGSLTQFKAGAIAKGATDTVTRIVNYGGDAQTAGSNNAFLTDNISFTGNHFIHQTGTTPSTFGGVIFPAAGNVSAPGISFDTGVGFYLNGSDIYAANGGSNTLKISSAGVLLYSAGSERIEVNATGVGLHGSAPVAKGTITGSRGGNAALASLLTYLASRGDITDSTS